MSVSLNGFRSEGFVSAALIPGLSQPMCLSAPQGRGHGFQHVVTQNEVMYDDRRRVQAHQRNHAPRTNFMNPMEHNCEGQILGDNRRNAPRKQLNPMPSQYRLGNAGCGLDQQKRVQSVLTEPGTELMQQRHGWWERRKLRAGHPPE